MSEFSHYLQDIKGNLLAVVSLATLIFRMAKKVQKLPWRRTIGKTKRLATKCFSAFQQVLRSTDAPSIRADKLWLTFWSIVAARLATFVFAGSLLVCSLLFAAEPAPTFTLVLKASALIFGLACLWRVATLHARRERQDLLSASKGTFWGRSLW